MKLLVRPITYEKKYEIESAIDEQKQRFENAVARSTEKVKRTASILDWVKDRPVKSSAVLMVAGYFLAQHFLAKNRR